MSIQINEQTTIVINSMKRVKTTNEGQELPCLYSRLSMHEGISC